MSNFLKRTKRGLIAFLFALLVTLFILGSQVALAASWKVVSSPSPGTVFNELYGVAALSASNIWAVGVSIGGDYGGQTLTEQYS